MNGMKMVILLEKILNVIKLVILRVTTMVYMTTIDLITAILWIRAQAVAMELLIPKVSP